MTASWKDERDSDITGMFERSKAKERPECAEACQDQLTFDSDKRNAFSAHESIRLL